MVEFIPCVKREDRISFGLAAARTKVVQKGRRARSFILRLRKIYLLLYLI